MSDAPSAAIAGADAIDQAGKTAPPPVPPVRVELPAPRAAPAAPAAASNGSDTDAEENWNGALRGPALHPGSEALGTLYDRIEAFVSRLSMRDNFWHSVCALIWLPLAFFSGIKMKQLDAKTFGAYLPFRRFNRNWYRAMAGGALLANSEIAGGMYVFGVCGGSYAIVCKQLNYTFLRPCYGPAVYRMTPRENIRQLMAAGAEFNITLDLDILQQASRFGQRDKRVGRCEATFHVTPKVHQKRRAARRRNGA